MTFSIDPNLCTGCLACVVYCSMSHVGGVNPDLSLIQVFHDENHEVIAPVVCPPCEEHNCLKACPVPGALSLSQVSALVIDEALCTGCRRCVDACLIEAIRIPDPVPGQKSLPWVCDRCGGDPWCVRVCATGAISFSDSASTGQESMLRLISAIHSFDNQGHKYE